MGLSLLNVISKSRIRIYKPKLLGNYLGRHTELKCTRLMSSFLQKKPIDTSKNVGTYLKEKKKKSVTINVSNTNHTYNQPV